MAGGTWLGLAYGWAMRLAAPERIQIAIVCGLAFTGLTSRRALAEEGAAADRESSAMTPEPEATALTSDSPVEHARPLAIAAALIPGVLVHGAGHYVVGERRTARRLLLLEGVGLGAAATGGLTVALSGASRWLSGPAIMVGALGIGIFGLGWLADIYGAAGGARRGARARTFTPPVLLHAGYGWVRDPEFDYQSFALAGGAVAWPGWRAALSGWVAVDDDNQRVRLEAAHRLAGVGSRRGGSDGSFFELSAAAGEHRYGSDAFAVDSGELVVGGRLDLARLGPSLGGSFVELAGGLQVEHMRYVEVSESDFGSQLLVRLGFGLYFGDPPGPNGEVALYYDHRRDQLVGGLALPRGSGFLGHLGVTGRIRLARGWGAVGGVATGSANLLHLGIVRELGEVAR